MVWPQKGQTIEPLDNVSNQKTNFKLARGVEPPTRCLQGSRSTNWATPASTLNLSRNDASPIYLKFIQEKMRRQQNIRKNA